MFPARYGRNAAGVSRAAATDPGTYNWAAPVDPGTLYASYFRPALAAVRLPATDTKTGARGVRLHDLRHTFAVLSLSAGAHYMAVSKWLGHKSYVTTLTIYAGYLDVEEGGKAVPLARPSAPPPPSPHRPTSSRSAAGRRARQASKGIDKAGILGYCPCIDEPRRTENVMGPSKPATAYPMGRCYCGCGAVLADPRAFFQSGHDKRAEARVIRERYGNVPNFLVAHGYGPDTPPLPQS